MLGLAAGDEPLGACGAPGTTKAARVGRGNGGPGGGVGLAATAEAGQTVSDPGQRDCPRAQNILE